MRKDLAQTGAHSAATQIEWLDDFSSAEERSLWFAVSVVERMLAAIALLLFTPLLLGAALVIACLSKCSPLIAHQRVGLNGEDLWVFKLRTMWSSSENRNWYLIERISDSPTEIKRPQDERITSAFAQLCRKYSIDELPQLWNVACGEMSLVGARPITAPELAEFYKGVDSEILSLKPGVTGLWQINGRNSLTMKERREFDLLWTRNRSVALYLTILLRTVPVVILGKHSW